jgi:hypothetical protein
MIPRQPRFEWKPRDPVPADPAGLPSMVRMWTVEQEFGRNEAPIAALRPEAVPLNAIALGHWRDALTFGSNERARLESDV